MALVLGVTVAAWLSDWCHSAVEGEQELVPLRLRTSHSKANARPSCRLTPCGPESGLTLQTKSIPETKQLKLFGDKKFSFSGSPEIPVWKDQSQDRWKLNGISQTNGTSDSNTRSKHYVNTKSRASPKWLSRPLPILQVWVYYCSLFRSYPNSQAQRTVFDKASYLGILLWFIWKTELEGTGESHLPSSHLLLRWPHQPKPRARGFIWISHVGGIICSSGAL